MPHSLRINFQLRPSKEREDSNEHKSLQEELDQALVLQNETISAIIKQCLEDQIKFKKYERLNFLVSLLLNAATSYFDISKIPIAGDNVMRHVCRKIIITYFENVQGEMCVYLGLLKEEIIAKTKSIIPTDEHVFIDQDIVTTITAKIKRCVCHMFHDTLKLTIYVKVLHVLKKRVNERSKRQKQSLNEKKFQKRQEKL